MLEYLLFFSKEERGCNFIKDMIIKESRRKKIFSEDLFISLKRY